jgi:tetratricopeptide (TPR) repeat protein
MGRKERPPGLKEIKTAKPLPAFSQPPGNSYLFQSAMHYHRAGILEKAEEIYWKVLGSDPTHSESLHFLGLIAHQTGRDKLALDLIGKALAVGKEVAEYHYSAGEVCRAIGRPQEAMAHYRRSIELKPDFIEPYYVLGLVLQERKELDRAVECYRSALARKPHWVEALNNLGNALQDIGKLDDAVNAYQRALTINPSFAVAWCNLGNAVKKQGKRADAACSFDRALVINPSLAEASYNLGTLLEEQGKLDEAIEWFHHALAIRPNFAEGHNNLGNALKEQGKLAQAIEHYKRAIAISPNFADAHNNLATALLVNGQLEQGWREHEWRWKSLSKNKVRSFSSHRQWQGEVLSRDKILLLHAEQGFGDTIQFCRYVPLAATRARVVLEAPPPLGRLLQGLRGVEKIIPYGEPLPAFDSQCPLMSLPLALRTTLATIPAPIPYLEAEPALVMRWRDVLPKANFRVGIVWQVNPRSELERARSIPLTCFAPLAKLRGLRLISLQKTHGLDQLQNLPDGMSVETLGPDFDSGPDAFLDTAAVMQHLDLVITADTATAHLAGALGRPTWIILRHMPYWTWMLNRCDSPWYPTVRLFRQERREDWNGVLSAVEAELRSIIGQ